MRAIKISKWASGDDLDEKAERLREQNDAKDYYITFSDRVAVVILLDKKIDELEMPKECLVKQGLAERGDFYLFCRRCSEFYDCPNAVLDDGEAAY